MTRHVQVGGRSAKIVVENSRLQFACEDGAEIEGAFTCSEVAAGTYSVVLNGKSHRVTVAGAEVLIDGMRIDLEVFDPRERRAAGSAGGAQGSRRITAPMPGKVVRVLAKAGDEVAEGQGLVVVEAMKMQNEIKSPKTGRVADVRVQAEATVAAGQVLMVVE